MKYTIEFADSALEDLENMQDYYTTVGVPDIGLKYSQNIFEKVENLVDHPLIGRTVPEYETLEIRELIYPPFRIVYRIKDKYVYIMRVWRTEQLLTDENIPERIVMETIE